MAIYNHKLDIRRFIFTLAITWQSLHSANPSVHTILISPSDSSVGSSVSVTDKNGNTFLTGHISSRLDFPVTPGAYTSAASPNGNEVFVTKFSSTGQVLFSTFIGGSAFDQPTAIAVDNDGNVYVAGHTSSA